MNTDIHIRPAATADARRISYLIQRNTEHVPENHYTPIQVATWKKANTPGQIRAQLKQRTIFCAFRNQRLVGTIALQGREVVGLYVSYSVRRAGIGGFLLQYVEAVALAKGIRQLHLTATPAARHFYANRGYQVIETVQVNISGVDFEETAMQKRLSAGKESES